MKILKGLFLSLLALALIAAMAIFLFLQIYDTDQFLPQITNKVALALGRPVSVGHLGLGFSSWGITLDVGPVTVADDSDFTAQPFIKIQTVRINVDLKDLIFAHQIHVTRILLQSPQLHLIRSRQGRFNADSIGKISRVIASPKGEAIPATTPKFVKIASSPSAALNSVSRNDMPKLIKIQDGAVSFIDQSDHMPLDIWIDGISAKAYGFSPSHSFKVSFRASFYGNVRNVRGRVAVKKSAGGLDLSDLGLYVDFSKIDRNAFKYISPDVTDNLFLKNLSGVMDLNLDHLSIGPAGVPAAQGRLNVSGVVIKDFNVIKILLARLLGSFGMGENLGSLVSGPLAAPDTVIQEAQAGFTLQNKTLNLDDASVKTNLMELSATGPIAQDLSMDLQTTVHLNQDVSSNLADKLDGLKFLMDDSKRITIVAELKGTPPHLKYKPNKDFRKKSRKMLMQEGGNILGILLGGGR